MRIVPIELLDAPQAQLVVFEKVLSGGSEKEISDALQISKHTVHSYIKSLYKRFNVTSRPLLIALVAKRLAERIHSLEQQRPASSDDREMIVL